MNARSRNEIYRWLRHCLIGPGSGGDLDSTSVDDFIRMQPLERFQTGILFRLGR